MWPVIESPQCRSQVVAALHAGQMQRRRYPSVHEVSDPDFRREVSGRAEAHRSAALAARWMVS
jgi:hypothetical protein